MANGQRIGLDIDGVLADTDRPALEAIGKHYGRQLDIRDWRTWRLSESFPDLPGVDEYSDSLFRDEAFMVGLPPLPGAVLGANLLAKLGKLFYVTHRTHDLHGCTWRWLEANWFPLGQLMTVDGSKAAVARDLKLTLFLEDRASTAMAVAEVCRVYLFDYPWNQEASHPNLIRVKDWPDFRRVFAND